MRARPPEPKVAVDAGALEGALRARISGEVRFDAGSRALYATDGSNYRQVPIGVVIPRDGRRRGRDRRASAASTARRSLARGGGTSLAGQCCNVAVVIDFSKYLNRDPRARSRARAAARVAARAACSTTCATRAEQHHLTFGARSRRPTTTARSAG